MYRKKRFDTFKYGIFAVIIALASILGACMVTPLTFADTSNTGYTNVLDDLQKDETFDVSKYPENTEDNSLQVIQIAESTDNHLFVYVYQPSGQAKDLRATSINMSLSQSGTNHNLYNLVYCNSSGTLYKYIVQDFTLSNADIRYYNITSIYRVWDETLDTPASDGQTISEVSFAVGQLWKVKTTEDGTIYDSTITDIVPVVDKYAGFVRYVDGFHLFPSYTALDSHFVAFSVDRPISELYSVKVYFEEQGYIENNLGMVDFGTVTPTSTVVYGENVEYTGSYGWVHYTYSWNRIQTATEFLRQNTTSDIYECGLFDLGVKNSMTEESFNKIKNMDFVLRFYETSYGSLHTNPPILGTESYTIVNNISLIELTYIYEGNPYTVGVVDNKQSGDTIPDNIHEEWVQLPEWLQTLLIALCCIVAVVLVVVLFPYIITLFTWLFKALFLVLKYIFIGLWYVLKYLALGIWYLIASPYYIYKFIQNS